MKTKVKVGVAGCGDVSRNTYLPNLARLHQQGRLDLAAVADIVAGRAATLAQQYRIPTAFTEFEQLLEADVDLVVNLTPMQVHADVTLAAIKAGKHVYTEKPIATDLDKAGEIIANAREAGITVAAAPALLTHPDIQQVIRWIQGDLIGKVCFARARASNPGPDRITDFKTDPTRYHQQGGGPLFDLGIYPVHVLTAALGPVQRVTAFSGIALPHRVVRAGEARGKEIHTDVDDNVHMVLDFGNAIFATIDATYCVLSSKGPRMEFYGETGVINLASTVEEPPLEVFRVDYEHELRGWVTPEKVYRGRVNPPRPQNQPHPYTLVDGVEHMIDVLEGKCCLLLTAEHARHVLEVLLAVQESASTGRAVTVQSEFSIPAL
ncbi:MAG: Gfo/Idh/MocA family oxidoreductase [Caldilineaceae bacterium]|nr:Gfo/Idh/MocA family oxidoreductase [Caldilineaceae bacterium]